MDMKTQKQFSDLGKRRAETGSRSNPAQWGDCEIAGNPSPSSRNCYNIGSWNVRRLHQQGKTAMCTTRDGKTTPRYPGDIGNLARCRRI